MSEESLSRKAGEFLGKVFGKGSKETLKDVGDNCFKDDSKLDECLNALDPDNAKDRVLEKSVGIFFDDLMGSFKEWLAGPPDIEKIRGWTADVAVSTKLLSKYDGSDYLSCIKACKDLRGIVDKLREDADKLKDVTEKETFLHYLGVIKGRLYGLEIDFAKNTEKEKAKTDRGIDAGSVL